MAPIALVTGTSTGIGLSAAIHLAQAGFHVVATLRNLDKAEPLRARAAAERLSLEVRELDVQSDASVHACVEGVLKDHGRIDVLVNNAGAGFLGSMEQTSSEALQRTLDVNFVGVWRVTRAVFPAMRRQRSGHVLAVTSVGGLIGQPFNDAYCAAKFAVEGFYESLAPVARRLGIHLSLIEPGAVNTEFVANVMATGSEMNTAQLAEYQPLFDAYMHSVRGSYAQAGQTADEVARVIVQAATAEQPSLRYITSERVRGLVSQKYVDPSGDALQALLGAYLG